MCDSNTQKTFATDRFVQKYSWKMVCIHERLPEWCVCVCVCVCVCPSMASRNVKGDITLEHVHSFHTESSIVFLVREEHPCDSQNEMTIVTNARLAFDPAAPKTTWSKMSGSEMQPVENLPHRLMFLSTQDAPRLVTAELCCFSVDG